MARQIVRRKRGFSNRQALQFGEQSLFSGNHYKLIPCTAVVKRVSHNLVEALRLTRVFVLLLFYSSATIDRLLSVINNRDGYSGVLKSSLPCIR